MEQDITETEGSLSVTGQWFYRPEEADKKGGGSWKASDTRELFYSFHIDDVPAESVMHKCVVHFIPQHKKIPSRKEHPGFIVQKVYDTVAKKLWNLTDKDYEDNKQHEIDLLVKKTIDRIGQLSDIEPADAPGDNNDQLSNKRGLRKRPVLPIDVSRDDALAGKSEQFGKAETPGSDKLKNYATLVKYKAVTGDQYRDRWLDKLVDTIPLTSKESAGASHADPGGATKSSTNGSSAKEVSSGVSCFFPCDGNGWNSKLLHVELIFHTLNLVWNMPHRNATVNYLGNIRLSYHLTFQQAYSSIWWWYEICICATNLLLYLTLTLFWFWVSVVNRLSLFLCSLDKWPGMTTNYRVHLTRHYWTSDCFTALPIPNIFLFVSSIFLSVLMCKHKD